MPIEKAFPKVKLEEQTHTYYVNGRVYKSVSSRIDEVTPEFPADAVAATMARNGEKTKEEILAEWKDINEKAIHLGNQAHEFGENYKKGNKPSTTRDLGIVHWWEQLDERYEVFSLEHPIYNEKGELAGTPDIILEDKETSTLVIADYKTNKDLFKVKGRKNLDYPFDGFENTNFNKYTIQLNYYQWMLEQAGYKVSNRILIWLTFDPEAFTFFSEYEVPNIQSRVSWHELHRHAETSILN